MASAVAITPASGSITAKTTMSRVDITGATPNATDGSEIRYYIRARLAGQDDLKSPQFAPSSDGKYTWFAPVFPAAGSWVVTLRKVSGDTQDATRTVVVA